MLKKYFDNNSIKKFIYLNFLLMMLFVFFVRKFNKRFRFYINYRVFNVFIIKNQYSYLFSFQIISSAHLSNQNLYNFKYYNYI